MSAEEEGVVSNWGTRPAALNDHFLRSAFQSLLDESAKAPPEQRLIMYDAVDETEVRENVGIFRKRIDARRNTKPNKPNDQRLVCTPFNPDGFNFGKIKNDRERIVKLAFPALGDQGRYDVLTNKFPLFPGHMLLVAKAQVAQQMTGTHLRAIVEMQQSSSFCAYFNSWCASASVNHFHCHLIDEHPPVTTFPLVDGPMVKGVRSLRPDGFKGTCYCFASSSLELVESLIKAMQVDNQPHNLLFTPRLVYVFPKPHVRPSRSFDLYPETVGGPELIGSFTVYQQEDYDALTLEGVEALCRMNTAPLPARLLAEASPAPSASLSHDENAALGWTDRDGRSVRQRVGEAPPRKVHANVWPQDRPIALALMRCNSAPIA